MNEFLLNPIITTQSTRGLRFDDVVAAARAQAAEYSRINDINVLANGGGLNRSKDYGSKKKPYPSVRSDDFAGGGRSYPIPTKADAVDALRLAGLHHRADVKVKVYKKYPSLKHPDGGPLNQKPPKNTYAHFNKDLTRWLSSDHRPLYSKVPDVINKNQINTSDPFNKVLDYQMARLHFVENNGDIGYDPEKQIYVAYNSPEGGKKTIGDGLKLNPNEEWTKIYNKQGYLTKLQHDMFVMDRIKHDFIKTRDRYDKVNNDYGAFDKLPPEWQAYLIDFNYNPGISQYTELPKAIYNNDLEKIKKESLRYMTTEDGKKLPLDRNKIMLKDADLIYNNKYTGTYE